MEIYAPAGLIDQDYIDLLRLVQDALDWDPTDGQLVLIELRLVAECKARGIALPSAPQ